MPSYTFPSTYPLVGARGTTLQGVELNLTILHKWQQTAPVMPKFKGFLTTHDLISLGQWSYWLSIWQTFYPESPMTITINPEFKPLARHLRTWSPEQWNALALHAGWHHDTPNDRQSATHHVIQDPHISFNMLNNWTHLVQAIEKYFPATLKQYVPAELITPSPLRFSAGTPMPTSASPAPASPAPASPASSKSPAPVSRVAPINTAKSDLRQIALSNLTGPATSSDPFLSKWKTLHALSQLTVHDSLTTYLSILLSNNTNIQAEWLSGWDWPPQVKNRLTQLLELERQSASAPLPLPMSYIR